VNTFLRLITRDLTIDITRHDMEAKVMEVGRQAGMLASTTEGKWARQFIFNVGVSHPMDLLKESWQADGRMKEHNPTRLFWTISRLTGNQWERRNSMYLPTETMATPKSALKAGKNWAEVATTETGASVRSVRVDESVLKAKLRQVKITGSRNKTNKFYSLTLSIPPSTDPATKFSEIASDFVTNMFSLDETTTFYPYQAKNRDKKKAIKSTDDMPKSAGGWNPYFERMFPLKKEGAKIYTGMVIGHDEDTDDLKDGITWWTMSNEHYFKEKEVQAEKVVDCVWFAYSPANWEPQSCTDWLTKQLDYKHQIGCRDKRINTGKAYNAKEKGSFAIHMEVSEPDFAQVFRKVTALVSLRANRKNMPLMIEMRAVPDLRALQKGQCGIFSESMISSCKAMSTKQGAFRKTSGQMTTWAFDNPDFEPPDLPKTLRTIVYSLKYDGKPLFHALTPEKSGNGQVFTFHQNHEHYARMMVMGLYVYVEHIHPGHGRRWFNADAIALAEGAYWDAINGVIVTPQDEALSEAVTENWWETDDLANAPGDGDEPPTRPDEGATREEPAITGDEEMLDHKFDDGKTVASYGNRLAPQIHVSTKDPASISAVTWDSDKSSLQQELAATQAKLKRMEEQMSAVTHGRAAADEQGQFVTPPHKVRHDNRKDGAGATSGVGEGP
jgi:hypothetical protein